MSAVIRQMIHRKRANEALAVDLRERQEQIIEAARGAKGDKGEDGAVGPMPRHEWKGTKLRFEQPDGWGQWVDLKGAPGKAGRVASGYGGGQSSPGLDSLTPGAAGTAPNGIAVLQGSQWVNLPWDAFLSVIAGAVDLDTTMSRRTDLVGDSLMYRGEAAPGALESAAAWRIRRIEFTPDGSVVELWASGSADMIFAWDDRASLTYL